MRERGEGECKGRKRKRKAGKDQIKKVKESNRKAKEKNAPRHSLASVPPEQTFCLIKIRVLPLRKLRC